MSDGHVTSDVAQALASASNEQDLMLKVRAEQLRMLFAHTTVGTLLATGFALALALYVNGLSPRGETIAWVAVKLAIASLRMLQNYLYRSRREPHSFRWEVWTLTLLGLDGAWWGIGGAWLLDGSIEVVTVLTASLASVASVATFGLQVRLLATAAYVVPMLGFPFVVLLQRLDSVGILGCLSLLFVLGVLLSTARRSETRLAEVFRLRFIFDRMSAERGDALQVAQRELERIQAERALEEERARVSAMHEVLVARSTFLAKISHELRSPLQGIVSALDVFEMRHGHRIAADDELIGRMRRSSMLLNTQLRDLLTLARGQAGHLELRPEPFDASALVEGVAASAREAAKAKALDLVVELAEPAMFVIADGARIDQVLTNLVMNSIRYSNAGRVVVALQPYDRAKGALQLMVGDTGPGIAPSMLTSLFAPDRLLGGTERKGEGSGIGLAIVGMLVEQMGGQVSVSSSPTAGTTFTIEIPAEPLAAPLSPVVEEPGRCVLIVDDRADVLDALASVVGELGYRSDRAASAAIGANRLAARTYDAVLFDLDMPFESGIELAADMRRIKGPNQSALFIGMSAAERPAPDGDDPFDLRLSKPIDQGALRTALLQAPSG